MAANTKADVLKKAGELDAKLKGKMFLGGNKPSAEDVKAFEELLGKGNAGLFRWVKNLASFTEAERKAFGAPVKITAPTITEAPAAAAAAPAKKEEPKKAAAAPKAAAPAAADDDDEDLFGEETEEEKAALEAKKKKDEEAKKAAGKKVVIAKSSILVDIKPWEDTTDLVALAAKIKAVERDGLLWGAHKLVPVAFGLKKLQLLLVIEDDKVSGDDLEDLLMGFEDDVQSIDIVAWNKV